jgi:hypothetical protein
VLHGQHQVARARIRGGGREGGREGGRGPSSLSRFCSPSLPFERLLSAPMRKRHTGRRERPRPCSSSPSLLPSLPPSLPPSRWQHFLVLETVPGLPPGRGKRKSERRVGRRASHAVFTPMLPTSGLLCPPPRARAMSTFHLHLPFLIPHWHPFPPEKAQQTTRRNRAGRQRGGNGEREGGGGGGTLPMPCL